MIFGGVVEAIGNTPTVRLKFDRDDVAVYAKLELQNLFSMKDRVARQIVIEARRTGQLRPGAPIVESSSGSMALGLAVVGRSLGHEVHIVTDPRIDPITLAKLTSLGCTVHVVPKMTGQGWQSARLERLAELRRTLPGAFWPRQYSNQENPRAYAALADELLTDLRRIDILVGSVGSGGSLCGTTRALRRRGQQVRSVAVDCVGSVLFGQPDRPERLQSGLGNSIHPPNLDLALIDEVHWLNDREAFAGARDLARQQQIFGGNTSGSVYRVVRELAATAPSGIAIAGIFPDRGDRYVGTVYDESHWESKRLGELPDAPTPQRVVPGTTVSSWSYVWLRRLASPDHLVFIESNTTGTGMTALVRARDAGFHPVLYTADPARYRGLADTGATLVTCDTGDAEAVYLRMMSGVGATRLAGVTTTSDFYLEMVAALAARARRSGNRPEAVAVCRNKARTRRTLADAGIPQPRYAIVRDVAAVADAVQDVGLPCVVKPADDSGSNNVVLCRTAAAAERHAGDILRVAFNARGQPTTATVLVEEYLPGAEFSVETFSSGGIAELVGITAKHVGFAPHFVETGHVFPASLPAATTARLWTTVDHALKAVGYEWGPAHTEVKITTGGQVSVVEINARLAGGMIPELIRLAYGVDLVQQQICASVDRPVHLKPTVSRYAGIRFLAASRAGRLQAVHGLDRARRVPGITAVEVTRNLASEVVPPTCAYDRIGFVIAACDHEADLAGALDEACQHIDLVVG